MLLNEMVIYFIHQSHPVDLMWNQIYACSVKFTLMNYVSDHKSQIVNGWLKKDNCHGNKMGVWGLSPPQRSVDPTVGLCIEYFFFLLNFGPQGSKRYNSVNIVGKTQNINSITLNTTEYRFSKMARESHTGKNIINLYCSNSGLSKLISWGISH